MTQAKKAEFFPSGIALGKAFYNREKEKKILLQNIIDIEPIVLVSPRRYGKTSLITEVIRENQLLAVFLDLLPATDEAYVNHAIVTGVEQAVSMLLQKKARLKNLLLRLFAKFNPKIVLTVFGQTIELSKSGNLQKTITEALLILDKAAESAKQNIVFVMDEFQQIGTLLNNHSIEASIRHAVERTQHVSYVFSGSNRQLLEQIFSDKKRPLYHLCDFLRLNRISKADYTFFLQKDARAHWHKQLDQEAVDEILGITQCHTYYVNRLCKLLWKQSALPTVDDVRDCWNQYIQENIYWIANIIGNLKPNQRKVLAMLIQTEVKEPQGNAFCKLTGLTPASIKRVIDSMLSKDYIYVDAEGNYKLLDPAILHYFSIGHFPFREF
jgi:AAA+ ATPase superfamily predicted ATPase